KYGIDAHLSKLFISDDAKVTAEGSTQYAINGQETTISGENTVVRMKCGPDARGTFKASTSLTLNDGLKIDTPEGAQYVDGEIKDASGNVIKDEWVTIQYTVDYDVKVAGIQVTNHNMTDVLGDGTVSYDPETLTLTLTDANIDGGDGSGIEADQELHIKLEGSNTITCTRSLNGTSKGIWFKGKGFIEGPGSLSITAMYGIYSLGGSQPKPLQILDGAQVSAEGDLKGIMAGITTISGEETVVNAKGGDGSFGCTGLNLNDQLEITEPAGASFNLSKLAICVGRRNDIVTSWVTIQKVDRYDLYVKGKQVTSINEEDVLGNGTVFFDPQTSTLTLMNAEIAPTGAPGIQSSIPNLNVMLVGGNFINISDDKEGIVLQKSSEDEASEVVFYGGGVLNIQTNGTALQTQADIAFTDGVSINAISYEANGIVGSADAGTLPILRISGTETIVTASGATGSLVGFSALNMDEALRIINPLEATFTENVGVTDAEGNLICNQQVLIAKYIEFYDLSVERMIVNEENKDDVLGNGTVSYDPETQTLTLNNANLTTEDYPGILAIISNLKINLVGQNTITSTGIGMQLDATSLGSTTVFCGNGSLNITSADPAILANTDIAFTDGVSVSAESTAGAGIKGNDGLGQLPSLTISGETTTLKAKGADEGSVVAFRALNMDDDIVIVEPAGATFTGDVGIVNAEGNLIVGEWVLFKKVETYMIDVANIRITDYNKSDVLGDGTVSFDPETRTLTLNGANIENNGISARYYSPITIKLIGENYVTTSSVWGIRCGNDATIEGSGSLYASGAVGIRSDNLTISGGAKVSAEGSSSGIFGNLTVKGEETIVQMKGGESGFEGRKLTIEDGLFLGLPVGAYFSDPYIVGLNGEPIKDEWIIIGPKDYIDGIASPKSSPEGKDLMYNLAGQKVGKDYRGIVIENGKKTLKK
ncbi:MAG: hypothetical protein J6W03_08990, partial [Bacteroidaceae bacterium]|nr:hypothetical protein [Bacteroidaceae bacterium]